jgi:hypothetical protein
MVHIADKNPEEARETITVRDRWNVLAVLIRPDGRKTIHGANIVTDDGDLYYAQRGAAETPTNSYVGIRLGTATGAPSKSDTDVGTEDSAGRKATDATYPQTNDPDSDNTGAGLDIVSWRFSYAKAEGNITGIAEGAIVDSLTSPTSALTHFLFAAPFTKTANDTLKVFVNHEFLGV